MPRVLTNGMSLSFTREASLGVLPVSPQWFELEPNTLNSFGTTTSSEARSPISKARARRKGTVTDLDSAVEFESDLTLTHLRLFAESFLFASATGGDSYITSAAVVGGYTVPALSGAQAGRMLYGVGAAITLVNAIGFDTVANNGLKPLTAKPAAGAVLIPVAGNAAEAPTATVMAEVSIAGVRAAVGDLSIDAAGNLTSAVLDFTTLGIARGQTIHIGGVDALHQFTNAANTGFARVEQLAAHKLTLGKRDQAFVTEAGAGINVDLLFGQFVRNVPLDHADFLQPSHQFELRSPNLMPGGAAGHEYAIGNWADALSISIPLTGKALLTLGFVGQNTTDPVAIRATNASAAKAGRQTEAFGTSSDIARLRMQDVDETGLTTDFKSATFTLTNNVAGEKVLGHLGPKYLNAGNIECDVENQMLFTSADVIHGIRCNTTFGLDWVLRNGDGGVAFDLPTGTLSGGGREYPANQSVLINDTFAAHQEDGKLGFTCGLSFFPVLPAQAC
ncbi:MAG: phage tail tube protein [Allosphingosinicella sp.]